MTLQPEQFYADVAGRGAMHQVMPTSIQGKTLAAGTGTLVALQPLAVNSSTGLWAPWDPEVVSESWSIATSGTVSGGTFTLTVNGETTAAIAYNAAAAAITSALLALGVLDAEDFTVTGDMPSVEIEFHGKWAGYNMTGSVGNGSITGGGTVTVLQSAGASPNGLNIIQGFLWPEDHTLNASGETVAAVMLGGRILYDSIPLVGGLYTADQLAAGLKTGDVRKAGFLIENLAGFH